MNCEEGNIYYRTILFLAFLGAVFFSSLCAQESLPASHHTPVTTQRGGRYITASGALNVLFVYVQFPDDNYLPSSPYWPKGKAPMYMNATVDSVWSVTPTPGSITDYFNQMSFNKFRITGTAVSVITPHTRKFYLDSGWRRSDIQEEVIKKLDTAIDFSQFDHWRHNLSAEYSNTDTSDGIVDMIFMMWRNVCNDTVDLRSVLDLVPGGEASLGYRSHIFGNSSFSVDGGARTVAMGSGRWEQGSGITAIHPLSGDLGPAIIWQYARHEFGHWLLGGNEYHTELGTWGLVDGWGTPSGCMNSFERYKLGWTNVTTIEDVSTPRTISNVSLPDFVTTGVAYRIKVPGGGSDEYYLLENHQRISVFDIPDNNVPTSKGLFVLLQKSNQGDAVGVVSADGRFNWSVPSQSPNIYGGKGDLPVFLRGSSNRVNGYSKRQSIPWTWQGVPQKPAPIHYYLDSATGTMHQAPPTIFTGDGKDQFDTGSAPVFTPASNPSSDIHDDTNKVGFEITNLVNGIYTLNIYINTNQNASPSKPQDLNGTAQQNGRNANPKLVWTTMLEPNVAAGGSILIFRRTKRSQGNWSDWSMIDSVTGSNNTYVDQTITIANSGPDSIQYRIEAKDSQHHISVYSDDVSYVCSFGQ